LAGLQPDAINRPESVDAVKNELIPLLAIRHHRWGAGSDIGRHRRQNQDAYFAQSTAIYAQSQPITVGLYLVADGIGGAAAGDLASRIVVETCQRSWGELLCDARFHEKTDSEWLHWVSGVLQKANDAIIEAAGGNEMGSTATLSLVINQRAYFAHIGDSRAYLISGENIEQLTDDHSLVARLVRMGALAPEDAVNHPQRHIIYKSLGIERTIAPDCFVHQLSASHALLICSDGLHGMVKDDQLLQVVIDENLGHTEKVNVLINRANEAGGTDNITAVYVTFH
jgi:protein phosphatase